MTVTETLPGGDLRGERCGPDVEIVVPVYNEERGLETSIRALRSYLDERLPFRSLVTIADNASTDATSWIARRLAAQIRLVRTVRLEEKGRGRALRTTWLQSEAAVVAYMDVDLSTDLDALYPLLAPLLSGHSELAIGTRLAPGSRVVRGAKRELISRSYNLILRCVLGTGFSDAQCGFKAMTTEAARALLPLVADDGWFFDTELLVLAHRNGLRIHEVPVDWVEDRDSRVDIAETARADLRGVARLLRLFAAGGGWADLTPQTRVAQGGELRWSAGIGLTSTLAYLLLFLALVASLGAFGANVVSLAVTSSLNAAVHELLRRGRGRHREPGRSRGVVAASTVSLALTSGALVLAGAIGPGVGNDLAALLIASLVAAPLRIVAAAAAGQTPGLPARRPLNDWVRS